MSADRAQIRNGKRGNKLVRLFDSEKPIPRPRKHDIRGRFLKYAKMRTSVDSHLMISISKNNPRKLTRKRSMALSLLLLVS